jgi:hypothetical protein
MHKLISGDATYEHLCKASITVTGCVQLMLLYAVYYMQLLKLHLRKSNSVIDH